MIREGMTSIAAAARLLAVLLIALAAAPHAAAQEPARPITIGQAIDFHSEILDEDRPILIHLPAGYGQSHTRYPVLYLLDAEANFVHVAGIVDFLSAFGPVPAIGTIPQMILVGIPNTNRPRDLTPAVLAGDDLSSYRAAGDSEKFLEFLDDELLPWVDENYRTEPFRILAGHCLAGLFSVHALLAEPEMFNAYVAVTPYLIMDEKVPLAYAGPFLQSHPDLDRFVYVAAGAEDEAWVGSIEKFASILKQHAPETMRWTYRRMHDDGHGAEVHKAIYDALEALYKGWSPTAECLDRGLAAVEAHYNRLSDVFGYEIVLPEATVNWLGYVMLQQQRTDEALAAFKRNVELYPDSWNVYDSLGEAYMARGDYELAIENYLKSLDLNPDNLNAKRMLERIRQR